MKLVHIAKVERESLHFADTERLNQDISRYHGKTIEVTIKEYKPKRSNQLNQYYWGVVVKIISDYTGYTKEETHELLKHTFLKKKILIKDGWFDTTNSTTKMNNKEMLDFIEQVKLWAAETLSLYIPDPHEKK
tara:strand:- start:378 stop:776 length:399 start_codon:yes stop_codon:yes gene_type:complete